MKRAIAAAAAAVLTAVVLLAVRAGSSPPASTDSGTASCTTDSQGYCTGPTLPFTPNAVTVEGQSPSTGPNIPLAHVTLLLSSSFRVRFLNQSGKALNGITVVYSYLATQAPQPTTSPPSSPPPAGFHAPGQDVNASNTGIVGDKVTTAQLAPVSGTVTYDSAFDGQTISLKAYSGEVVISGSHITVQDCTLTNGGPNSVGFLLRGDHNTVRNCLISAPAGQSMYEPIWIFGDSNSVVGNDVSRGENLLTTYGTNVSITGNYLHDVALDSDPSDHPDGVEIYGGGPTSIVGNRIVEGALYDSPINAAPYGSYTLTGLTVADNFLDNGQSMTLIDNQSTAAPGLAGIQNTKIVRNAMGGHTNPDTGGSFGSYKALENYENRPIVQTDAQLAADPSAIEWPTTGADANHWEETQTAPALTPGHDGQIVLPTCPNPC